MPGRWRMTESRPGHHAWNRWDAFALLFVFTLGLANPPQPFAWDQALFAINARVLNDGGALYRDAWDVKQPGIYLFYWLGGGTTIVTYAPRDSSRRAPPG